MVHVNLWLYLFSTCIHTLILHPWLWVSARPRCCSQHKVKGSHLSLTPCGASWSGRSRQGLHKNVPMSGRGQQEGDKNRGGELMLWRAPSVGSPVTQTACEDWSRDITGTGTAQCKDSAAEASSGPENCRGGWWDSRRREKWTKLACCGYTSQEGLGQRRSSGFGMTCSLWLSLGE